MKTTRIMITIAFALFAIVGSAVAQTGAVRVSVPFSFTVGNQTLPAGDYKVEISGSVLQVARLGGAGTATAMTNLTGGGPSQDLGARLVFHRYGDHRFLSQAWLGEIRMGHELFASAAEVQYARSTTQETVTVAVANLPK